MKCWLCGREIGCHPDSFNVVYDIEDSNQPRAICVNCSPKYNKIVGNKMIPDTSEG